MNQIILIKPINQLHKRFFKVQFIISILVLIALMFYDFNKWKQEEEMEKVSQIVNKAFEVEGVYEKQRTLMEEKKQKNKYFGKIIIPKIDLEYSVFNECNDELLKILPCKFYGVNLHEQGNICIAGHNYKDTRFFGELEKLNKGDTVYLEDLNGKKDKYIVYDKYKVKPDNFECLKANRKYDLTLITCDNLSHKRVVVKAERESKNNLITY